MNLRVKFTISDPVLLLGCDWCWFGSSEKDEFSTAAVRIDRCLKRGSVGQELQALNLPWAAAVGSLQAMSGEESESGLGQGGASPLRR